MTETLEPTDACLYCKRGVSPSEDLKKPNAYAGSVCVPCHLKIKKLMAGEFLDETRLRFRREFPKYAKTLEFIIEHYASLLPPYSEEEYLEAFAVGSGHSHNVKFKEEK